MPAHTHEELVTRANKVRSAVADHDVDRLQRELASLRIAFDEHRALEHATILALPHDESHHLLRSQARVAECLASLAMAAGGGEIGPRTQSLSLELVTLLALQVDAERRAVARAEITLGDLITAD